MEETPKRHIACGICRRRKLKCDGRRPTCSTCQRLHQVCEYSDVVRKAGPKRGYVRSLESRITQLEGLLSEYHISEKAGSQSIAGASLGTPTPHGGPHPAPHGGAHGQGHGPSSIGSHGSSSDEEEIPAAIKQELTEIFFLKCNIIHAVLDRRRYLASMEYPLIHQPPPYLQYAVMCSAACVTPKFFHLKPQLYEYARTYLGRAEEALRDGTPSIYYICALGLIAHFNMRECRIRMAWLEVGKAWRAIIMLSLNMLDAATWQQRTYDTAAVAEARRIFWFIYFCDRAGSMAVCMPPIINPDDVYVKMPMDDEAFLLGRAADLECFSMEELLSSPNMFTQYKNARQTLTNCIMEVNYQLLELGRFPSKKFLNKPSEWFASFTHFDQLLSNLISVVPLVPPVPASSAEGNKVLTEEKSRRTSFLVIYIWSQAGLLLAARSGFNGIQQFPTILPIANPGRLVQRTLMTMLEVLLVSRNPHDLEVIGMHPVYPVVLFALAVVILVLAEHNLVALDNFRGPVEYIMNTLRELSSIMPVCDLLSEFLVHMAPQLARRNAPNVNRVEDVLTQRGLDLSLPNFLDGSSVHSMESSPLSSMCSDTKPTPPYFEVTPTQTQGAQAQAQAQTQAQAQRPHPGQAPGAPPGAQGHTQTQARPGSSDAPESFNFMPIYDEPFDEGLLDIEPPSYLPEIKGELDFDWAS